jgi:hypothetical protein
MSPVSILALQGSLCPFQHYDFKLHFMPLGSTMYIHRNVAYPVLFLLIHMYWSAFCDKLVLSNFSPHCYVQAQMYSRGFPADV